MIRSTGTAQKNSRSDGERRRQEGRLGLLQPAASSLVPGQSQVNSTKDFGAILAQTNRFSPDPIAG